MGLKRRNALTRLDSQLVALVAAASAVVAALADVAPTGDGVVDTVLAGAVGAAVAWLAATSPWWALIAGSGIVFVASLGGPIAPTIAAGVAFVAAGWIGWTHANQPIVRSLIGAVVVQVAFRLAWDPFFTSSALVATLAIGIVAIMGLLRRQRYVRRRCYWTLLGAAVIVVIAVAGLAVAGVRARSTAQDGYVAMLDGLDLVQEGRTLDASEVLSSAAGDLQTASDTLGGPLTQPVRLVPGLAQNRNGAADVIAQAADAAAAAADALVVVDLDRLTVSGGRVDIDALADLEAPLRDLADTVDDLRRALDDADSPWLVAPFQDRLARVDQRADQVAHQAAATAATAEFAPAMLGADGPRRYFIAFVNTAEARGQGGLMGNWSEITVDDGRIRVSASGRSAELQTESLRDLQLDVSNEYITRYGNYGATTAGDDGVDPKFWSNVTMPADMPSASSPMAQMYEQATGRQVDGVFVIDPDGLGALVDVIGSIDVESVDRSFDGDELREFLLLDQYEIEEAEREDVLEEITAVTIVSLFTESLPPPQELAEGLSDAALNGHLTGWATDPDAQRLLELAGMDGRLPVMASGTDGLAVVSNNASGNKIESFLERTIEYRPTVDQRTGDVTATLTLTMTNTAPTRGFTDYVIGNIVGAPTGTNRMLLDVYTALDVDAARLDGRELDTFTNPELGYSVYRQLLDIPAGDTVVVELELAGNVGPGRYQLALRPQALPNADQILVDATTVDGDEIFTFDGELARRSVLSESGVRAWRANGAD